MHVETKRRLIALAIGLGTITGGLFAWRAGQIGSGANYDDRQSIGQQIDLENVRIDVTVEASRQARQYDRYVGEYAIAEGYDADAEDLRAAGEEGLAALAEAEADDRRRVATERAFASGVFDVSTLANSQEVTAEPRPFDLEQRIDSLLTERTTGLASSGPLDPQALANASDAARARVRTLIQWVAVLLAAVVCLTAGQVTVSGRVRRTAVPVGLALLAVGIVGGFTHGFFA